MKQLLQQYSAYNLWANKRLLEVIDPLPDRLKDTEVSSSFSSILKTLIHIYDAESMWLQRIKLSEHPIIPSEVNGLNFKDVSNGLLACSKQWHEWLVNTSELKMAHVFEYRNTKKQLFKQPVYEVVMHVVNHGTYHRGQLITILHHLGIDQLPATDFILFCRSK